MYRREILTLPLSNTVKQKLQAHGCLTVTDLRTHTTRMLIDEAGLDTSEAVEVLREVHRIDIEGLTGDALLAIQEGPGRKIVTGCEDIDEMLEGVVHGYDLLGGGPGIGKTQLGMQLCVNAAVPQACGGLGGQSAYIDTEGSFSVDRIVEICNGTIKQLHQSHRTINHQAQRAASELTVDKILSGVHYFRANNCIQQLAALRNLPSFLQEHREVRLIVVDSISIHFRQGFDDMSFRTRLLNLLAQNMMELAESKNVAVVYMNQVTKRVYENNESETVPVLGDSWGQCVSTQVRLYWNASIRYAGAYKASHLEQKAVPYQITEDGVRSLTQTGV